MSWWVWGILGVGIAVVVGSITVFIRRYEDIVHDEAVAQVKAELTKQEIKDVRTASDELVKHVETDDTVKNLEDGKF